MLAQESKIAVETIETMPRVQNDTEILPVGLQTIIGAEAKYGFIPRSFPATDMIASGIGLP